MRALLVFCLVALGGGALAGCASRSTASLLDAAEVAENAGDSRTAAGLYRDAAHRGDTGAAMWLTGRGVDKHSLGDWLFDSRPTHAEARWWEARVRREAARQIAAGDTTGHLTLGALAFTHIHTVHGIDRDSARVARRQFDAAAALGSRGALGSRAMLVWMTDGMLAAEPYFRESARAGSAANAHLASMVIMNRPRLEHGPDTAYVPGDWSQQDVVGSIRYLRSAGFPELVTEAEAQIEGFRIQAREGDAVADSIVRALDAPGPSRAS